MNDEEQEDATVYDVVVNHEEQYSIWPKDRDVPRGWKAVGRSGPKSECLDYIEQVWTDMRPLSVRRQMEALQARRPEFEAIEAKRIEQARSQPTDPRDDLVSYLCNGDHPVRIEQRPERSVATFREAVDRGYVHIKFTDTRGGTELGVSLDAEASDFSKADFNEKVGTARIVGRLTLDYVKLRCVAEIDLGSLSGQGRLERIGS